MKKLSFVFLLSIVLLANAASIARAEQGPSAKDIEKLLKSGKLVLPATDTSADAEAKAASDAPPPEAEFAEPPPLSEEAAQMMAPPPPMPGYVPDLFDTYKTFKCSTVELNSSKQPVFNKDGTPRFKAFDADYNSCEFVGPIGEHWHALFPGHPAHGDPTCELALAAQRVGKCISCFETPKEGCKGDNTLASLPSANTRATFDASPQLHYTDAPPSLSYATRVELIKRAKKSIRIQYLIFYGDESGWEITKLLIKKKQEIPGIDIRVNVDAASSIMPGLTLTTQDMYFDLKQHGIPVEGYEFAGLGWVNEFSLSHPTIVDRRWHDKIFAIDAEDPDNAYAVVGGQNIANEYFRIGYKQVKGMAAGTENIWRDQDVVIHGPIVRDVAKSFDNNFAHFKLVKKTKGTLLGLSLNTDEYWESFVNLINKIDPDKVGNPKRPEGTTEWSGAFPRFSLKTAIVNKLVVGKNPTWQVEPAPKGVSHKVFRLELHQLAPDKRTVDQVRALSDAVDPNRVCGAADLAKAGREFKAAVEGRGKVTQGCSVLAQLKLEPSTVRWFNNHPRYGETYIMQAYVEAIATAKKSILISNAYFIPSAEQLDAKFVQGLKDAAASPRCVDVTILTNAAEASDGPMVEIAGRSFYKDLMSANTRDNVKKCGRETMKLWEWQGHKYKEYTNHAKFAVFDETDAIVGSFNLDPRSAKLNSETILMLRNKTVAQQMYNQIMRYDIGEKSTPVTPALADEYAKPGTWKGTLDNWKSLLGLQEL